LGTVFVHFHFDRPFWIELLHSHKYLQPFHSQLYFQMLSLFECIEHMSVSVIAKLQQRLINHGSIHQASWFGPEPYLFYLAHINEG